MSSVYEEQSSSFANKYRPLKLSDVVGQDLVKRYIYNAVTLPKLHHAYLFSGPSGTGKTTIARIFASCVNSPGGSTVDTDVTPGTICHSIVTGGCVDIRELDAASNRSIDDIREIRNEIQYAPLQVSKRFIIIDEAHGLTGAAAEAALKMIEEPPQHTIFILCTTEPEKLKDTVYGRCISLNFMKISDDLISSRLRDVCKKEKIIYHDDAIAYIAKNSSGCMRLSLQNLEKCFMSIREKDGELDLDTCLPVLRCPESMSAIALIESIVDKDIQGAMLAVNREISRGMPAELIVAGLIEQLRNIMIAKSCTKPSHLLSVTNSEKEAIKRILPKMSVQTVLDIIQAAGDFSRGASSGMNAVALLDALVVRSVMVSHRNENGEQKRASQQSAGSI